MYLITLKVELNPTISFQNKVLKEFDQNNEIKTLLQNIFWWFSSTLF